MSAEINGSLLARSRRRASQAAQESVVSQVNCESKEV